MKIEDGKKYINRRGEVVAIDGKLRYQPKDGHGMLLFKHSERGKGNVDTQALYDEYGHLKGHLEGSRIHLAMQQYYDYDLIHECVSWRITLFVLNALEDFLNGT